jgi:hypothetical protein
MGIEVQYRIERIGERLLRPSRTSRPVLSEDGHAGYGGGAKCTLGLPLKVLMAQGPQGKPWRSFNTPEYLAERHGCLGRRRFVSGGQNTGDGRRPRRRGRPANLIAHAADGPNQGTIVAGVHLSPQVVDVDVDNVGHRVKVQLPDLLHDR